MAPLAPRDESQQIKVGAKLLAEITDVRLLAVLRATEGPITLEDKGQRLVVVINEHVLMFQV